MREFDFPVNFSRVDGQVNLSRSLGSTTQNQDEQHAAAMDDLLTSDPGGFERCARSACQSWNFSVQIQVYKVVERQLHWPLIPLQRAEPRSSSPGSLTSGLASTQSISPYY
jgi:hypothetical protein